MILENKVVQKLKLEKNVFFYKKWSPKLIFLKDFFLKKFLIETTFNNSGCSATADKEEKKIRFVQNYSENSLFIKSKMGIFIRQVVFGSVYLETINDSLFLFMHSIFSFPIFPCMMVIHSIFSVIICQLNGSFFMIVFTRPLYHIDSIRDSYKGGLISDTGILPD